MALSQNAEDALIISAAVAGVLALLLAYYLYRRHSHAKEINQHLLEDGTLNDNNATENRNSKTYSGSGATSGQANNNIDGTHYRVKKQLGDGAYGSVYLAIRRSDHTPVAVKVIPCRTEQEAKESMNEFHIARSVQEHKNVVKVFDVFVDNPVDEPNNANNNNNAAGAMQKGGPQRVNPGAASSLLQALRVRAPPAERYLCIVSEYCEEGTLFDLLITIRKANSTGGRKSAGSASTRQSSSAVAGLSEDIVWLYTEQLLEALAYLHSKNLMHRDLKPSNVLLTDNHKKILLTDFGLSRVVEEKEYAKTRTGTLQYMSPEQVQRRYNNKGDVWGVGCLVHAMCTAKVSTSEAKIMFRDRAKENFESVMRNEELAGYSAELADFMLELLAQSYQDRPSAMQALENCRRRMKNRE